MNRSLAIVDDGGRLQLSQGGALPIYSIAKTMIASAVYQSGIDLDTPIARWIEPTWVPRNTDITVRQLLLHSSGLRDYGGLPEYAQAIERREAPWSDEQYAAHTLRLPLLFAPGTSFAYSNPGYWCLKRILERVYDSSWSAILHDRITAPLGLNDTRVVTGRFAPDLPDYPAEWVWHGVIVASAADVARFMASPLIEPLRRDKIKVPGAAPPWVDAHYGYGLMIEPGSMYGHNGNGPGYSASCFHFMGEALTGCVLTPAKVEDAAMDMLKDMVSAYAGA